MIPKKVRDGFNEQIQHEFFSAYLYLSMAAYMSSIGLEGFAQWFRVQALEEQVHAMKFFDHIIEREGKVELLALKKPAIKWKSPLDAYRAALEHERFITGRIDGLVKLAEQQKDFASRTMLQWFVDEQVEEEGSVSKIIQKLEMIGESGDGTFMLDKELGTRTFTMPAPAGE